MLFILSLEEQQNQSEEAESMSCVKKWGFRRTTIARREFLEEVGDLAHSPPPVRKTRGRRIIQTPLNTPETQESPRHTSTARSVVDELEWSAPSSPVSEDSKPATEIFAGGNLDPSLWQDCGSAFHTAFSLLGGGESFQVEMPDALAVPDTRGAGDSIEPYAECVTEESAMPIKDDFPDGILDGETFLGEIGEMLTQKGGPERKCTTIRGVKGRKGRGRPPVADDSPNPNNEDSPGGGMLLREIGEMLTRKGGQERSYTTVRGKRRGRLCPTDESPMPDNVDCLDGNAHSVLDDVVLISTQEVGRSDSEMLLTQPEEMVTQDGGREQRGLKRRGRPCLTDESAMPDNEDSPNDGLQAGLGGVREDADVVLISPHEEADSDGEVTLIEVGQLLTSEVGQDQGTARGVKGGKGRGRKKGRGRGRRKAKGRGKGRGKAGGLQSKAVDDQVVIVNPATNEPVAETLNGPGSPIEISTSPAQSLSSLSPAQRTSSDCICLESDTDQVIAETHDQFDDAPEQKDEEVNGNGEPPLIPDPEGCDPDALTCVCRQKRNDRYTRFLNELRGFRNVKTSHSC